MKNIFGNFIFMIFLLCLLAIPQNIYAYIDPGTGSYFVQLIIGGILGVLFLIKVYWKKIINFFVKKQKGQKDNEYKQ